MKLVTWIGILLLLGLPSRSWSQANPTQPVTPDLPVNSNPGIQTDNTKKIAPDTRPLAGAEQLTLGGDAEKHTILQPQFSVSQMFDSNPVVQQGSNYQAVTVISGRFDLDQQSQSNQLRLRYEGTGIVYPTNTQFDTHYHSAYVGETFFSHRWSMLVSDQVTYSPESSFGYGLGGFGGFGVLGGGLNPNYVPNQSILTGLASRIDNTVVGQISYRVSPRGSITASASYGLLHYMESGRFDTNQIVTNGGYDHRFSARDTIGFSYTHTFFRYTSLGQQGFETHGASLTYGRRVTGRLSLRLSAGPQVYVFESATSVRDQRNTTYATDGSLLYRRGGTEISISGMRGATGGSGVMVGAKTYQVGTSLSQSLGRGWKTYVSGGYAHNDWVSGSADLSTVYGGGGLRRSLGRSAGLYFNYNALRQTGSAVCITIGTCNSGPVRHVFGFGFDFSPTPIRLH